MVKKIFILIIICSGVFCLYSQNKNSVEEMFSPPERRPIMKDLCRFVLDNIEYPQSAIGDTVSGDVLIDFYVETNGNTSNHRVIKGVRGDLNNEALRVAKLLKFDKPAYTRGKAVRTIYLLSISFLLNYDYLHSRHTPIIRCSDILNEDYLMPQECKTVNNDSTSNNELITYIESAPLFKGCLTKFIADNIKYPKTAQMDSLEGTVFVSYWINVDGSTINHKIEKGIRKDLNTEALRVTKLIHYEKPAMQKGRAIKVRYVVPVKFNLSASSCKPLI